MPGWSAGGCRRVIVGGEHEALVVGDGGLEGFRCCAVEGARVGPDPGGGGRLGVGLGCGGGRLKGVTGEGGPVQPTVPGGAHVCPPVCPSLLGVARVCPCGQVYDDHLPGVGPWYHVGGCGVFVGV